jgi:hypothetical protein
LQRIHPVAALASLVVVGAIVCSTAAAGTSASTSRPGRPAALAAGHESELTARQTAQFRPVVGAPSLGLGQGQPLRTIARPDASVITIARTNKTIEVRGTLRSGGVELVSALRGQLVLIRFDQNASKRRLRLALARTAVNANALDGVAVIVVDVAARDGHSAVQAILRPGRYEALNITSARRSSWRSTYFRVVRSKRPATLAKPGARVEAIDFGFHGARRLHVGELVRFGNRGYLVHMITFYRAGSRKDARRIAADLRRGRVAKARRLAVRTGMFAGPLSHNQWQQQVIANHPGYYVIACLLRTQSGRYQTRLGMERVIRIVR